MRLLKIITLFILVVMSSVVIAHAEVVERIVAVVNDDIITSFELDRDFVPVEKRIDATYQGPDKERLIRETKMSLLQRMIDKLLLEQEAKRTGIVVKDEEVTAAIRDILGRQNATMDDLNKTLVKEGITLKTYRDDVREQMVRMQILRREVRSKITISDEEIGDYYLKHREEYEGKEAVRIKQILLLFPRDMDEATKNKLQEQANMILQRLKGGESFDFLAATFSQGPAAAQGGDLGFVEKGLMLSEVDRVAFSLGKDEVSGVIESSVGFHILKMVDKRGAGIKPIGAVRAEITARIEEGKLEKKYEGWMDELRKRSHIEIKM